MILRSDPFVFDNSEIAYKIACQSVQLLLFNFTGTQTTFLFSSDVGCLTCKMHKIDFLMYLLMNWKQFLPVFLISCFNYADIIHNLAFLNWNFLAYWIIAINSSCYLHVKLQVTVTHFLQKFHNTSLSQNQGILPFEPIEDF